MPSAVRGSTSIAPGPAALAAGSALSGLLAYVFFSVATRALGPDGAAPVVVLWTFWAFAAASLTFPIQHWVVRAIAAAGHEGEVRRALPQIAVVAFVVAVLCAGIAWGERESFFHSGEKVFPALVGVVALGSAFIGLVRGVLVARHRLVATGLCLVGENGLRCMGAAVLVGLGTNSPVAFGCTLASGQLVGLFWPSTLRLAGPADRAANGSWHLFVGPAAIGQTLSQTVLTGAPVVLALSGAPPGEVTGLFAALALFRAPYSLAIGGLAHLTGVVTSLVASGNHHAIAHVRRALLLGVPAVAALAWALGVWLGPTLVSLVFGSGVHVNAEAAGLIALGSAVALGGLAASVLVMAMLQTSAMVWAWAAGMLVAAVTLLAGDPASAVGVAWAFTGAELTAFVLLMVGSGSRRR